MPQGKTPTVLQILPTLNTGGVERGTLEIARALREAGWNALVASAGGQLVQRLREMGAEHIELPLDKKDPLNLWRNSGQLKWLLRARGVDVLHARSRAPAWSGYYAARAARVPFVTTFHGTYGLGGFGKKAYNRIMTRGRPVIAISQFIGAHIEENYGLSRQQIEVIPRGVDITMFDPAQVGRPRVEALAQKWRLPDGAFIIMLPGRLTGWKGQMVLVEALQHLRDLDVMAVLVGPVTSRGFEQRLLQAIHHGGLADRVRLAGDCNDMPAALMLADVVVSTSLEPEAFGRAAVEAQAMGRPVLATDHGGARETVLPGQTGWLTPVGDARALAEHIRTVYNMDRKARLAMGQRGRQNVLAHYDSAAMCAKTMAVYKRVMKKHV